MCSKGTRKRFSVGVSRASRKAEINCEPGGRLELILAILTTDIVFTSPKGPKRVFPRWDGCPVSPARKRRMMEEERRPQRQPPLPGFLHSLLDAFLSTLIKGEQRAVSGATKQRGNLCPVCPRIKTNETPAVEKKFFKGLKKNNSAKTEESNRDAGCVENEGSDLYTKKKKR